MTILQASRDRSDVGATDVDSTDADGDTAGARGRRTFRAATLEEAVASAADELGPDLKVIEANRIRRGGLGGFFATDLGVEVVVEPAAKRNDPPTDVVERLMERFGERDADRFVPSTERSAAPAVAAPKRQAPAAAPAPAASAPTVSERIATRLATGRPAPRVDDDRPIFDMSDDLGDRDDDGPIFDLSDERADDASDRDGSGDIEIGAPDGLEADGTRDLAAAPGGPDDDVFAPIEPEHHPFADQLEAELRAMSDTSEPAFEPPFPSGLVEAPRIAPLLPDVVTVDVDDPPVSQHHDEESPGKPVVEASAAEVDPAVEPVLDVEVVAVAASPTVATDLPTLVETPVDVAIDEVLDVPLDEVLVDEVLVDEVLVDDAVDGTPVDEVLADEVLADDATVDSVSVDDPPAPVERGPEVLADDGSETEEPISDGAPAAAAEDPALADLDALLRRAGVDPLAEFDDTPTLVDRPAPAPVPSTGLVFDATDRLSEQLSAIDAMSGRSEGLRRMQVKISGADGTQVEMTAEWGDRG